MNRYWYLSFQWIPWVDKHGYRHQNYPSTCTNSRVMLIFVILWLIRLGYGGHLEFWQNPPWDSWGLFCVISTRCPESIYTNAALTSKFLPLEIILAIKGRLDLKIWENATISIFSKWPLEAIFDNIVPIFFGPGHDLTYTLKHIQFRNHKSAGKLSKNNNIYLTHSKICFKNKCQKDQLAAILKTSLWSPAQLYKSTTGQSWCGRVHSMVLKRL